MEEKRSPLPLSELLLLDKDLAEFLVSHPDMPEISARTFAYVRIWGEVPPVEIKSEFDRIHDLATNNPTGLSKWDILILNRLALDEEDF
jgi:hypothetical protein